MNLSCELYKIFNNLKILSKFIDFAYEVQNKEEDESNLNTIKSYIENFDKQIPENYFGVEIQIFNDQKIIDPYLRRWGIWYEYYTFKIICETCHTQENSHFGNDYSFYGHIILFDDEPEFYIDDSEVVNFVNDAKKFKEYMFNENFNSYEVSFSIWEKN